MQHTFMLCTNMYLYKYIYTYIHFVYQHTFCVPTYICINIHRSCREFIGGHGCSNEGTWRQGSAPAHGTGTHMHSQAATHCNTLQHTATHHAFTGTHTHAFSKDSLLPCKMSGEFTFEKIQLRRGGRTNSPKCVL